MAKTKADIIRRILLIVGVSIIGAMLVTIGTLALIPTNLRPAVNLQADDIILHFNSPEHGQNQRYIGFNVSENRDQYNEIISLVNNAFRTNMLVALSTGRVGNNMYHISFDQHGSPHADTLHRERGASFVLEFVWNRRTTTNEINRLFHPSGDFYRNEFVTFSRIAVVITPSTRSAGEVSLYFNEHYNPGMNVRVTTRGNFGDLYSFLTDFVETRGL